MKKVIAICLLTLFGCLLAGTGLVRYGLKRSARTEMRQQLKGEVPATALCYFSPDDLKHAVWEKDDEIRLDGRLYDIARVVRKNGRLYFGCINDALEQRLEGQAASLAEDMLGHPGTPRGRLAKALLDWMQGLYFSPPQLPAAGFLALDPRPAIPSRTQPYLLPFLEHAFPPPERSHASVS